MPFSLPLHRPNRQARHTDNTTQLATPSPGPAQDGVEAASQGGDGAAEITDSPAATAVAVDQSPASTTGNPPHHVNRPPPRTVYRAPPPHTLGRSSPSSSVGGRHRFNWHSVTAPPPPTPPLQRPNGVAPPFSTSLHRPGPLQPDREHRTPFAPPVPASGNLYPLQYHYIQHQGPEVGREGGRGSPQVHKCSGPENEHRRCFTQVGSFLFFSLLLTPSHTFSLPPVICFYSIHRLYIVLTPSYTLFLPLIHLKSRLLLLTPSHTHHSLLVPLTFSHSLSLTLAATQSFPHLLTLFVLLSPSLTLSLHLSSSHPSHFSSSFSIPLFTSSHSESHGLTPSSSHSFSFAFPSTHFHSLLLSLLLPPTSSLSHLLTPFYSYSFTLSPSVSHPLAASHSHLIRLTPSSSHSLLIHSYTFLLPLTPLYSHLSHY